MKKIYEFPVLHAGWEMDDKGWVAIDDNGRKVIILTNHGSECVASVEELREKIEKYKAVIEATEKAIEMVTGL